MKPRAVDNPGRETQTSMICSICSSACRDLRQLRGDFVTCVGQNGNPNGARWDDGLTPDDARNMRSDPRYATLRGAATADALSSEDIAGKTQQNAAPCTPVHHVRSEVC
ncbi:hypothetical protein HO173_008559 [Letharia columbiana]|uniref:Uncharacterized protein n=1 Tax=Letharia columbiana TaxID=112416 RepID=A0A8H6FRB6_9LECA|nr:uncharacterized protein HO173_008559 [Letharia columbiana]KAF6233268.1 hypothetical protein HO173_008559 [Letharia columbiana]